MSKRKALIISLGFLVFGQWLIFSQAGLNIKIALSILFFLLAFFYSERSYLKKKVIFRQTLPLIMLMGVLSFLLFELNGFLQEGVIIFMSFCLYFFYSRAEIPLPQKESRQVTYHWLDLCILFSIYLISLALYQLVYFANLPLWGLVLFLALLGGGLFGYGLWARRVAKQPLLVYTFTFILIILEAFMVLSFWQEAYPLYKALILALLYYVYMGLLDFKIKNIRLRSRYLGFLIFATAIFLLIVFTLDWRSFS